MTFAVPRPWYQSAHSSPVWTQPEEIGAVRKPWEEYMAERIRLAVADAANAAAICLNRSESVPTRRCSRAPPG